MSVEAKQTHPGEERQGFHWKSRRQERVEAPEPKVTMMAPLEHHQQYEVNDATAIRVLLADDHRILRAGLRSLLEEEGNMEVVAEAGDGWSAVKMARELSPDVVIMDIGMEGLNGVDATHRICATCSNVKVLALSMHRDEQFVVGMLAAGASGYLLKDCAAEELPRAIRAALAGDTYLSPPISRMVVKDYVARLSQDEWVPSSVLTAKEREILQLLAEGMRSKQIAARLNLSARTVEAHRRDIMDKLNILDKSTTGASDSRASLGDYLTDISVRPSLNHA
jgi:two-component system, NarL family, response regulator NreC